MPNTTRFLYVTITLRVHPLDGRKVRVLKTHGPSRIWVEVDEHDVRIIPAAWTDMWPRPRLGLVDGREVLLAPAGLSELAAWVAARMVAGKQ